MNKVTRTLEIDAETDARLREMASERGQDVAAELAEAVALLDSVVDLAGPDIGEDRHRYDPFKQTPPAVPLNDVNRARSYDPSFARRDAGCRATARLSRSAKSRCRTARSCIDLDDDRPATGISRVGDANRRCRHTPDRDPL